MTFGEFLGARPTSVIAAPGSRWTQHSFQTRGMRWSCRCHWLLDSWSRCAEWVAGQTPQTGYGHTAGHSQLLGLHHISHIFQSLVVLVESHLNPFKDPLAYNHRAFAGLHQLCWRDRASCKPKVTGSCKRFALFRMYWAIFEEGPQIVGGQSLTKRRTHSTDGAMFLHVFTNFAYTSGLLLLRRAQDSVHQPATLPDIASNSSKCLWTWGIGRSWWGYWQRMPLFRISFAETPHLLPFGKWIQILAKHCQTR